MEQKTITFVPEEMEERAPYHLLTSICAPRPIVLISTVNPEGTPNLAPFSFYNAVAGFPPMIMFSVSYRARALPKEKDTLRNVKATGEFVANVVDEQLADAMIVTAADWPSNVNEFDAAGLEAAASIHVTPPRVLAAPAAMECKVTQVIPLEGSTNVMVIGKVVCFHIRENLYRPNGLVDTTKMKPITRLGGLVEYTKIGELFYLKHPEIDPITGKIK